MAAPREIEELVERFERNVEAYKSGRYNETQLRREFIDPFFKALGWDVENRGGRLGLQREVIHEDSVQVRESTKNPDYGFYIGQARKFFVEAKKPAVNLENDVKAAFQLRSYAWSAGLPISLLTDFEEFSIYDCRIEPANTDSPRVGLLRHFTYDKYIDHWDEIAALFSREAVLGGSLERYIESKKKARGTITVDEAFLREIDHWREILAKNVHRSNPDLTVRELNSSVQNTIDRIVFLRICEDRGIEKFGQLKDQLAGEMTVYAKLVELFRQADEKYNSGLFHFGDDSSRTGEPDRLALSLKIDDAVLSEMIENLYPPVSPYRFAVIPAEILGHVYEQFLGKVISLGEGGDVEVEYKPEVRKAGGVYYTPTYIVDYIVENTVGKLLEGETPAAVSELRILDPACGSGSFLIGAYQRLLDWHLGWYADHLVPLLEAGAPETSKDVRALLPESYNTTANSTAGGAGNGRRRGRGRPRKSSTRASATQTGQFPIFQASGGEWRLTTAERKRILLNNICGVDIDLQATEVTKLSLQLKVLEGENQETLSRQLTLFHDRALPDLGENIKCGNSLIGPDFYDGQTSLFDEEEMYRVNAFDWEAEFPEIMSRGGFDAVIGNPPYGAYLHEAEKPYLNFTYTCQSYQLDSYLLFLEKSLKRLLKFGGLYGMIIPNPWLTNLLQNKIRRLVTNKTRIIEIVHFKYPVFPKVTVDTEIVILQRSNPDDWTAQVTIAKSCDEFVDRNSNSAIAQIFHEQQKWIDKNGDVINIFMDSSETDLVEKCVRRCYPLSELCAINVGIKPYQSGKGKPPQTKEVVKNRIYDSDRKLDDSYRQYLRGKDINRYKIDPIELRYIKYGPWLAEPRPAANFDAPAKIFMRQTGDSLVGTIDFGGLLCLNNMHVLVPSTNHPYINYMLGCINSKLLNWYYHALNPEVGEALAEVKKTNVARLPIRTIDFSDPQDVARHDRMVKLVENMLDLHRRVAEAKTGHEKTLLSRQIEATDRQIDGLVYELYGLTKEEIAIVEEATK